MEKLQNKINNIKYLYESKNYEESLILCKEFLTDPTASSDLAVWKKEYITKNKRI